jgi:hypothetical protein
MATFNSASEKKRALRIPPFRQRPRSRRVVAGRREQLALQRRVVELLRDRPSDTDHRGAPDIFRDRRAADPDRSGDHPLARPTGVLQAQDFSNLPHRQSLGGHQTSLCESQKKDRARLRLPTTLPESPHQQGGRLPSDWVAAFDRNRWPLSIGMGGRFPSESVVALPRNPHDKAGSKDGIGVVGMEACGAADSRYSGARFDSGSCSDAGGDDLLCGATVRASFDSVCGSDRRIELRCAGAKGRGPHSLRTTDTCTKQPFRVSSRMCKT